MTQLNRRQFLLAAAAMGAAPAWARGQAKPSSRLVTERRDLYPEGVASGDPDGHSVILWTRHLFSGRSRARLVVEVAEDDTFGRVIVTEDVWVSAAADWTCRVLVGNLRPARVYWYRFIDEDGYASRPGRTLTAPADDDTHPVRFAFVSCQDANLGTLHAYRRLIAEDIKAARQEQLDFVLHLGDFIYEAVWYPEDYPNATYSGRRIRDLVRYAHGERIEQESGPIHVPTTLDDYRSVYRAYLHDPDLQDARARWPFVCIWDNHEFSWAGWQSMQLFNSKDRPAQRLKVAANQAWFEYQPARVAKSGGPSLEAFAPPSVHDAPIHEFDEHGFGDEPNNRTAVASLTGYRAMRWGRLLDLILTDQWSYRSENPSSRPEASVFASAEFPRMEPQEVLEILDGGRAFANGNPPATIRFAGRDFPNFRRSEPAQTILGARQRAWFLDRLERSPATWKVWGCSLSTLEWRFDPQNLPAGLTKPWPGQGYASHANRDYGSAFMERAEIYSRVRDRGITGFATVSGDCHTFWAGLAAPALPPQPFDPVGVAFVTGSISSSGMFESYEHRLPANHPLRPLYVAERPGAAGPEPTANILMLHGVKSALEYVKSGDIQRARAISNPDLSPHLKFLDNGGHGYSVVRLTSDAFECEFVCIPRPVEPALSPEGPPVVYRVRHRVPLWKPGEVPKMEQNVLEGDPKLSI